jgi:hypothetical protein
MYYKSMHAKAYLAASVEGRLLGLPLLSIDVLLLRASACVFVLACSCGACVTFICASRAALAVAH